jgi:hypothetical protein
MEGRLLLWLDRRVRGVLGIGCVAPRVARRAHLRPCVSRPKLAVTTNAREVALPRLDSELGKGYKKRGVGLYAAVIMPITPQARRAPAAGAAA